MERRSFLADRAHLILDSFPAVGFADTGLKHSYPNLSWVILMSQDQREALAPVRALGRFARIEQNREQDEAQDNRAFRSCLT